MIPLAMIVIDEFLEGPSEMVLAERHDPIEALVFDRAHKSFGIGVRIGRLKRCLHDVHSGLFQQALHIPAPLPVAVTDQHPMIAQQAVGCGQRLEQVTRNDLFYYSGSQFTTEPDYGDLIIKILDHP